MVAHIDKNASMRNRRNNIVNALENIVHQNKMPVLFVGSGISKRYLHNYPNWNELLELSYRKISSDPLQYQKHIDSLSRKGLSTFEINTELGSIIENEFNSAFFDRKIRIGSSSHKHMPAWVKQNISPYKMFLALYFKKMDIHRSKHLLMEIEKFQNLKNKISAVITTNYDSFLEKHIFTTDFEVFVRQEDLFSADSYNIAEIYKIHGSIDDADSIIITRQDYQYFNNSRKLIIAKMLTLFAESPIVFLGYSFTDENVQSIISDFLSCLSKKQLEDIDKHFVFISYEKGEKDFKEIHRSITTSDGTTIPITDIRTDNFSKVYDTLNQITPGISPKKIRETKRIVKTIVEQSSESDNPTATIIGIDSLEELDLSGKPLAIAVGYKENIINRYGYELVSEKAIIEDILFDNKHLDAKAMCLERFKSIPVTRLIPIHKYLRQYPNAIRENEKIRNYVATHKTYEQIIAKNIEKHIKNVPVINDWDELILRIGNADTINKKAGIVLKNIRNLETRQIRELCIDIYHENPDEAIQSTHFKRCIMCIDLQENYLS